MKKICPEIREFSLKGFLIVFPFRLNGRFFLAKSLFSLGIIFGFSGKCLWFQLANSNSELFISEKEDIEHFYAIRKKLGA